MLKRNINIDLLKIISMFMIVVLHLLNKGGLIKASNINEVNYYVYNFILIISFICVNLFGLITGYLMIDSKWKLKNLITLWFTVIFYSYAIALISPFLIGKDINTIIFFNSFFPLSKTVYWYFSSYFGLYLLIPLLNKGIKSLSTREFRLGILILFIISTITTLFRSDPFTLNTGYSTIWLACLYFIGAYIKLTININKISLSKVLPKYLIINIFLFFSIIILPKIETYFLGKPTGENWFITYTSPFILCNSILFFIMINKIKLNNTSVNTFISKLSPLTFSVYLIHTHPIIFKYIIKDSFAMYAQQNIVFTIITLSLTALFIFISCTVIDYLRTKLFILLNINSCAVIISNFIKQTAKHF